MEKAVFSLANLCARLMMRLLLFTLDPLRQYTVEGRHPSGAFPLADKNSIGQSLGGLFKRTAGEAKYTCQEKCNWECGTS